MGESFVYVICCIKEGIEKPPVKIGISDSPIARLSSMRTGHFEELALHREFLFPNRNIARDVEECFHHVFNSSRIRGEWFDIEPKKAASGILILTFWSLSALTDLTDDEKAHAMNIVEGGLGGRILSA